MTSLEQFKYNLETYAKMAPEYQRETRNINNITTFANKYCEAFDNQEELEKDIYFSALMLKFWDQVAKIYLKVRTAGKTIEDAAHTLSSCIEIACAPQNRIWQKNKSVNAQQAINQTIATRGIAQIMYESNLKKNRVNVNTLSLDAPIENSDITRMDLMVDRSLTPDDVYDNKVNPTIQKCLNNNYVVEAIIMDNMATKDCFKYKSHLKKEIDEETGEEYKYTRTTSEFWPYKLVRELNDLDDSYINYFTSTYKVSLDKFKAAFEAIRKASNAKKYKMIKSCQEVGQMILG